MIGSVSPHRRTVYLDWNATAPLLPEAREAMLEALGEVGNASSVHAHGRAARKRVEESRRAVAALIGADPQGVIFTSGGTEANALCLSGRTGAILALATEHAAVLEAAPNIERIPVDGFGLVRLDRLEERLAQGGVALLSIQAANNETGVLQPLAAVTRLARRFGVPVHSDAVQAPGRVSFDMDRLELTYASVSAHKIGGPQGIGALAFRRGAEPVPLIRGGGQEFRLRAGTENVAAIAGFGAAAAAVAADSPRQAALRMKELRDGLEARLKQSVPDLVIVGAEALRLPNTSCLILPGVSAETQLMRLDLDGISVSSGAACSSGKVGASHVLAAMGLDESSARSAIRVSLGRGTTTEEVDAFAESWERIAAGRVRPG